MSIPEHAVSIELDVQFNHCDPLGVVWHGRYFEYFEAARTALMRSIDLDVAEIRDLGYKLFVVDARCRYMRSLSYGDRARCTAWFTKPNPHVRIAFELYNLSHSARVARSTMVFAVTKHDGTLLTEVPSVFMSKLPS